MSELKRGLDEFDKERRGRRQALAWGLILALITMGIGFFFGAHCARGQELDYEELILTSAFVTGTQIVPSYMTEQEEPFVTFSGSVELWSQYEQLTGGIAHDKPVLQGNITIGIKDFYIDVWGSRAEGAWMSSYGDEVDISFGYAPNDNVDIGVSYIVAADDAGPDLGWMYAQITTRTFTEGAWSLSAFLRGDYYWPLKHDGLPSGYNFHFGATLSREWELWSAESGAVVLYDTGAFGAGEGLVWRGHVEVARTVGASTVGIGVKYSRGINLPEWDDRTGEYAFGTFVRF